MNDGTSNGLMKEFVAFFSETPCVGHMFVIGQEMSRAIVRNQKNVILSFISLRLSHVCLTFMALRKDSLQASSPIGNTLRVHMCTPTYGTDESYPQDQRKRLDSPMPMTKWNKARQVDRRHVQRNDQRSPSRERSCIVARRAWIESGDGLAREITSA